MNITKGQKKKKSIELLRKLHIYEAYIDGFRKNDYVCYFEGYGGYWVYQDPELEKKMKALEKEYACTVYAITHEFTEFGECYSFLLVTDYKEEWDYLRILRRRRLRDSKKITLGGFTNVGITNQNLGYAYPIRRRNRRKAFYELLRQQAFNRRIFRISRRRTLISRRTRL